MLVRPNPYRSCLHLRIQTKMQHSFSSNVDPEGCSEALLRARSLFQDALSSHMTDQPVTSELDEKDVDPDDAKQECVDSPAGSDLTERASSSQIMKRKLDGAGVDDINGKSIKSQPKRRPASKSNHAKPVENQSYILNLYDRSVDLAQFPPDSSLYPVCRAWIENRPQFIRSGKKKRTDAANDDDDGQHIETNNCNKDTELLVGGGMSSDQNVDNGSSNAALVANKSDQNKQCPALDQQRKEEHCAGDGDLTNAESQEEENGDSELTDREKDLDVFELPRPLTIADLCNSIHERDSKEFDDIIYNFDNHSIRIPIVKNEKGFNVSEFDISLNSCELSGESLIADHLQNWLQVKGLWNKQASLNNLRYKESTEILTSLFRR